MKSCGGEIPRRGAAKASGFFAALFSAAAGAVTGLYAGLAFGGVSPAIAGALLVGVLAWAAWRRDAASDARRAAIPFLALFIPIFFLPDYFVGVGPSRGTALVVAAVSLCGFTALRHLSSGGGCERVADRLSRGAGRIVFAATLLFIIALSLYGIVRYYNFGFSGNDLGCFIQSYWTTLRGRLFWNTHDVYPGVSHFGKHFSPVMFLVLPLFAAAPHGVTLIIINAACLGLGALVIYALARDSLGGYPALCFSLAYLMYPGIDYPAWNLCFLMNYAPLVFLLALLYYRRERLLPFLLLLVLACSIREDVVLTAFVFGIYALIQRRGAAWTALPAALCALWFIAAVGVIIPSLGPGSIAEFYADMGGSVGGIVRTAAASPRAVLARFLAPDYLRLVYLIFMPLALVLPLMSSEIIFAVPSLVIIALSSMGQTRYIAGYYYMPLIPFIFAGAMKTIERFSSGRRLGWLGEGEPARIACTLLLFLALSVFSRGFLLETIQNGITRPRNVRAREEYNDVLWRSIGTIPPEASVFLPRYMMPHLAKREVVSEKVPDDAEYLIIDSGSEDEFTRDILALDMLKGINRNRRYTKVFDEKGVRVYRRMPGD